MGKQSTIETDAAELRQATYPTQTSRYDEVNAWLVAGNLLCGFLFVVLMLVWIFAERPFDRSSVIVGPSKHLKTQDQSQLAEGEVDFPDNTKVAFERTQEALPRLDKIIAEIGTMKANEGHGRDGHGGIGGGGDRRLPDEIPPTVPPHQRWQIQYSVDNMDQYRKQLDFFEIEIGVVYSNQNKIVRVSKLSDRPQLTHSSREAENKNQSLYFVHKNSRLKRWDQAMAREAGASLKDAFTVEFFSSKIQSQLAGLESLAVSQMGKSLDEVAKTEFRIQEVDGEYKFVVHNVSYR